MPRRPPMKTVSKEIELFSRKASSVITEIHYFCNENAITTDDAYLDFECDDYYGSTMHRFRVYATVPMTKEEIKAERAELRDRQKSQRENIKKQLATLKEKFPEEFNEIAQDKDA